jgi:hypothetical protein
LLASSSQLDEAEAELARLAARGQRASFLDFIERLIQIFRRSVRQP